MDVGIFSVVRRGDQPTIEAWLQSGKATVEDRDVEQNTPLHVAAEVQKNEIAILQTFLQYGADVNAVNAIGATPLHYVALRKSKARAVANVLLECVADPNVRTMAGKSPLHFACQKNAAEFVDILLLCQADPMAVGAQGELPMHDLLASAGRDTVKLELLDALMRVGVSLDVPDAKGWGPMHHAAQQGFLRVVHRLLEAKCTHSALTVHGETPLHLAAQAGHTELTQALVLAGPECVDVGDRDGNSALHKCAAGGHADAATVLVKNGANTGMRNYANQTAMDLASKKSADLFNQHNPELVALLRTKNPSSPCSQM